MLNKPNTHECFAARSEVKSGSERSFGLVFTVVFVIIGFWPLLDGENIRAWALVVGMIFALAAFFIPAALKPLNKAWFKFGLLLHKIINPVIMGFLFYLTIMPIGLIMRMLGKDILNLRIDKSSPTYWIRRDTPKPESLRNQF